MEGGYCICRIDDKGKKWKTAIDLTLSKQVKVEKYKKRERMQK